MDIRIRDVDPELHRQFKTICARDGYSMDSKVKELIDRFVKEKADKPKK
jgi:plasmid stability protein